MRRVAAGLSVRSMASALKRSSTFVRAYESGKASLTLEELEAAAAVLGASLADLVDEYERGGTGPGFQDARRGSEP